MYKHKHKLELSRAHTPRVPSICNLLHRDGPVMLTTSTRPVVRLHCILLVLVGMVDAPRGYDSLQKDAIRDVRGPCQTIRSTFKPVFR